jgi:hypothetical protein
LQPLLATLQRCNAAGREPPSGAAGPEARRLQWSAAVALGDLETEELPMTRLQIVLGVVLAAFSFETAWALQHFGFVGFFENLFSSFAGMLVLFDLTIALSLVLAWMWRDARERGASFWPYVPLTLAFGSVGPLLYLIVRVGALKRAADPRLAQPA